MAPTEVIDVKPVACTCGQTVCLDTSPDSTHQMIEPPENQMIVRHYVLYEASCPQCGQVTKAQLPPEPSARHGPRLTALLGELSGSQRASRSAVQEFCRSVLGVYLSGGAIQRAIDRVSDAIAPHDEAIALKARGASVNYIDETSWFQHGVLAWWWVMVNTTVICFQVQASRSTAAFEALVKRWAGILVSDGYGVYCQWVHGRQTCLAHLLRRARGLAERQDPELTRFGHRVLTELQRLVHWAITPRRAGRSRPGMRAWCTCWTSIESGRTRRGRPPGPWSASWAPYGRLWWKRTSSPSTTAPSGRCGLPCPGAS
ncbi:MAG TPA: transposase [Alphaproteobacteria bacterium]|nr:transposase [Alphaproteobacteria bacterium]